MVTSKDRYRWHLKRLRREKMYKILAQAVIGGIERIRTDYKNAIEFGCSVGMLLKELRITKKIGVDNSCVARDNFCGDVPFVLSDLNTEHDEFGVYDVIICLEVAEHLECNGALADMPLLKTIENSAEAGTVLVFSAAPPWQRGRGHINTKIHRDWIRVLENLGWVYHHDASMFFAYTLGVLMGIRRNSNMCYRNNTMFFVRGA